MNREQAKLLVEMGLQKVKELPFDTKGVEEHWNVIEGFADGLDVLCRGESLLWYLRDSPRFNYRGEYKIGNKETFKIGNEEFIKPTVEEFRESGGFILHPFSESGYMFSFSNSRAESDIEILIERKYVFLTECDVKRAVKAMGWVE